MEAAFHNHPDNPSPRPPTAPPATASWSAIIATPLPLPRLGILCDRSHIVRIRFLPATVPLMPDAIHAPEADLIRRLTAALSDYFSNARADTFDLPTAAAGSAFQHRVWEEISAIPSGETRSYGSLARALKTSARAIGGACRANPLPLLVPCHRVIAADGGNGGFLGQPARQGMSATVKEWLLRHERD
jgi:methylated-DNA-[protein]-cysteine S-methyltransferase